MVTTAEARTQLEAQRRALQQRQQQIKAIALRKLTRAELAKQTRESILQRKFQTEQLEVQKRQALRVLKPVEQQLTTAEKEVQKVEDINVLREKQKQAWKTAVKHVESKISPYWIDDPIVKDYMQDIYKRQAEGERIYGDPTVLAEVPQLKPVYYKGELVGYEDPVQKMTISIEHYKGIPAPPFGFLAPELPPGLFPPTDQPVGVVEDVKEIPTIVSVAPKGLEKIQRFVNIKISEALHTAEVGGKELLESITAVTTIPASVAEEQRVDWIKLPTPPGVTQITRPVDFQDIDVGVLPPKQNLELKTTQILTDFSLGKISESEALTKLEAGQKQYIWEESKRTAALRFIEGAGIGALTILAPPVGYALIGITGADAFAKRKEILAFAKTNPKAAAIQFAAGVAGGLVAAGGISAIKAKSVKFREPTIKLVGKSRTKLINNILKNLEPDQRVEFGIMKKTATRAFKIDIPSPKNKVSLKIVEFTKNGKKMFAGLEFMNGKVRTGVGGLSIVKGKGGDASIVTRSIRFHTKKGLTNLEISEYLEKVSTKAVKSKGLRDIVLTENEVRLAKMFGLKGLTPAQVREILRRPLFGAKEAQKRSGIPFTNAEFKAASKLSKAQFITSREIVKTRLTKLNERLNPLIAERDIVDIRVVERGIGSVDIVFNLPKPIFKIKPKIGRVRVPGKVHGVGIVVKKLKKADIPKMPHRTPLSRTFADETSQILRQRISSGKKIRLLQKLKKDVSPIGAFKEIAKRIQHERINLAMKQAAGKVAVIGVVTGIKVTPKAKALTKQRQLTLVKSLSKQKDGASIAQITPTIVKEAEALALAGKITQVQLQTLKSKLILRQGFIAPARRVPTRPPKIPPPLIIIKVPKGVSKTATVKALVDLGKQGVDIITGLKERKKQIIRKNLPAFKALKFARGFVDRNIEASFNLIPSGKKAKGKDIKPFNVGIKFRPSKVNPLFLVEKRKFRLDHPQEKLQIKRARRIAPKKKPKRRKK